MDNAARRLAAISAEIAKTALSVEPALSRGDADALDAARHCLRKLHAAWDMAYAVLAAQPEGGPLVPGDTGSL